MPLPYLWVWVSLGLEFTTSNPNRLYMEPQTPAHRTGRAVSAKLLESFEMQPGASRKQHTVQFLARFKRWWTVERTLPGDEDVCLLRARKPRGAAAAAARKAVTAAGAAGVAGAAGGAVCTCA